MELFLFFSLILSIIILSALISGSEAALLSISYIKVKDIVSNSKDKENKRAKSLLIIKENLQKYITTIVVLNNLVNIVGSMYIGVLAAKIFGSSYLGLVSAVLTFFIIMFSEIIPKIYGEMHNVKISLFITPILFFLTKIFSPLIYTLNSISSFFVKSTVKNSVSEGEIKEMALIGQKEGSINEYESEVINNVFKMDDIDVYDIMVPKNEVETLVSDSNYHEIVKLAEKTGYTRFPIIENSEVIGIINVKDLFKYYNKQEKFQVSKILRPIFYVPETMKIFTLEKRFKVEKTHIAVIVNEHGDFTGIITLEDIIEELLGEIEDEFDKDEVKLIKKINEKKYLVKSNIDIDDLFEQLNLEKTSEFEGEFSTLNGFLIEKLGRIPRVNTKLKLENLNLRVIKASKKKAIEVELFIKK